MLLVSADAAGTTAVAWLFRVIPQHTTLGCFLIGTGVSAIAGSLVERRLSLMSLLLIIPQQLTLLLSALGACFAISASAFADGVVRPRLFIAADQLPAILSALFHTCAIVETYMRPLWQPLLEKVWKHGGRP